MGETIVVAGAEMEWIAESFRKIAKAAERMVEISEAAAKKASQTNDLTMKILEKQLKELEKLDV